MVQGDELSQYGPADVVFGRLVGLRACFYFARWPECKAPGIQARRVEADSFLCLDVLPKAIGQVTSTSSVTAIRPSGGDDTETRCLRGRRNCASARDHGSLPAGRMKDFKTR